MPQERRIRPYVHVEDGLAEECLSAMIHSCLPLPDACPRKGCKAVALRSGRRLAVSARNAEGSGLVVKLAHQLDDQVGQLDEAAITAHNDITGALIAGLLQSGDG